MNANERNTLRQLINQARRQRLADRRTSHSNCVLCGEPLPDTYWTLRRFCSDAHRKKYHATHNGKPT